MEDNNITELFSGEKNFIANASNLCAYIYHNFPEINWVGFYLLSGNELILGPFQGKVACIRIPVGKGVCGTAVMEEKAIIVPDVNQFPGHIVCDSASQSEIVIPLIFNGKIMGVLDIDSPVKNRFKTTDQELFQSFLRNLCEASDLNKLIHYYSDEN